MLQKTPPTPAEKLDQLIQDNLVELVKEINHGDPAEGKSDRKAMKTAARKIKNHILNEFSRVLQADQSPAGNLAAQEKIEAECERVKSIASRYKKPAIGLANAEAVAAINGRYPKLAAFMIDSETHVVKALEKLRAKLDPV